MSALARAHPTAAIEVWAQDEHRVGLKPIVRRVWHRRGQRPRALGRPGYQWLYVYAFVQPQTRRTYWLLLPSVSIALFSRALAEFAAAQGAGPTRHIALVLDRAGWHASAQVVVSDGLSLVPLPAYSPELQPAERLWRLVDEPLANRPFERIEEVEAVLSERCRGLAEHPEWVLGPGYAWWPAPLPPSAT